ncbi:hypothetical protein MCHUDSM44219_01416 [Mycolicibacterium chubuense]|jgi:hypothetical protein|uniref:Uncharacterized protein n=1 Tax=Mycolicibacterium chubuense TaxID=1800 RepID=A0A0J6WN80_MYCCU|nr:hypothetical protein MCHUDSM44219_01416 [Mycolicibacterium chubuense]SPX96001.1 Uncharacterised protein [Mycolicibacterium chubuense]
MITVRGRVPRVRASHGLGNRGAFPVGAAVLR